MTRRLLYIAEILKYIIQLTQKRSENIYIYTCIYSWKCSWNIWCKVFLTFSECLCGSFSHKHHGIFTENLTSDYPFCFLPITSYSCRPSLILYIPGCFMVCVEQYWTCKLQSHHETLGLKKKLFGSGNEAEKFRVGR